MRLYWKCCAVCLLLFLSLSYAQAQPQGRPFSVEADYFHGTILEHNPKIGHLITHHPQGFILRYNRKTFGEQPWEQRYNYPDWGFSFSYQDMKNPHLGQLYGVYGHLGFYFLQRYARLVVGTGVAYGTQPYHPDDNYWNNSYSTSLVSATYLSALFGKDNLWNGWGAHAGLSVIHYSNGSLKTPNTSTNTLGLTIGLNYQLDADGFPTYIRTEQERYSEPIKWNLLFRFGLNEPEVVGIGQYPFYVISAFADKTLSRKSTLSAGAEVFFSMAMKEYIYYQSVAYPEGNTTGDEDYKRIGLFAGYDLRFDKNAVFVNLGYYVYYPYDFAGRTYNRIGLKRYWGTDEHFFTSVNVRAHAAKAEAMEIGVGYRF